jgi:H+/gluconate symporter-like permease
MPSHAGLPGGRVVAVATAVVVAAALIEVLVQDTIGSWTGITLVVVAVVASLLTRAGDRSLPAMMPPLAFLAAALTAGQLLVPSGNDPLWFREALMLLDVLGANAVWVVAATVLSVTISTIRHVVDQSRARRAR